MSNSSLKGLSAITRGLSEGPTPTEGRDVTALPDGLHKPIEVEPSPDKTRMLIVTHPKQQPEDGQRGPGRPPGRRSDPDYERVTVLVPKDTRKTAERTWEDTGGKDLSQLVELLLRGYVAAPTIKPEG